MQSSVMCGVRFNMMERRPLVAVGQKTTDRICDSLESHEETEQTETQSRRTVSQDASRNLLQSYSAVKSLRHLCKNAVKSNVINRFSLSITFY